MANNSSSVEAVQVGMFARLEIEAAGVACVEACQQRERWRARGMQEAVEFWDDLARGDSTRAFYAAAGMVL